MMTAINTPVWSAIASWYSVEACKYNKDNKCPTASGRSLYDLEKRGISFCASNDYQLGTRIKVTNQANGKFTLVEVLDRGGFKKYGREVDLCKKAFSQIADLKLGTINVTIEKEN